jgi:rod shape-determining protein MreC
MVAASLERLLELQKAIGSRSYAARVVSADTSAYFRTARVHLGTHPEAIKPGMAVLAPSGVVGRVQRVYGAWGDAALLVDPAVAIDVLVGKSQARGVVRGRPGRNRLRCGLQFVDRAADVKPGDPVVASGMDGVFPRGALVGTLEKVTTTGNLFLEADVKPAVDFAELSEVLIAPGLEL